MDDFITSSLAVGLTSFVVALAVGTGPLLYVAFRINTRMIRDDEDKLIKGGNRSVGLEMGTTMVCQAILMRHAATAAEAAVRSLFIYRYPTAEIFVVLGRCILFVVVMAIFAIGSIAVAGAIFRRLSKEIDELLEIENDNLAVAIFYGLVLIAIAIVLDPGMQDLAHSWCRCFVPDIWGRHDGAAERLKPAGGHIGRRYSQHLCASGDALALESPKRAAAKCCPGGRRRKALSEEQT